MLEDEESFALSSAQQLLVVMYFSGPCLVVDRLLHSPVCIAYHSLVYCHFKLSWFSPVD